MQTSQISSIEANLFEAIKANDIKAVEELLKKNVPLHSYNEENLTPLMVAAKHGYQEIIKLLVSKGASLYQRSGKINEEYWGQGLTAEKVAQVHRQFQAEDLLNTFAFRYQNQYRSCVSALRTGDWSSLSNRLFANYWHDINAQGGEDGQTILMQAAKISSLYMVKNLLEVGADVNRRDGRLETALHYASGNDRGSIVALDTPDLSNDLKTYYHAQNCYHIVKTLVEAGANLNAQNIFKETPLIRFMRKGDKEVALFLIEQGADVNLRDENEISPLNIAASSGDIELAGKLLEKGADINEIGFENKTPLQWAFIYQKKEVIRFLIEKGADVNVTFEDGQTLARVAVDRYDDEILDLLLQAGADINIKDKYGKSALYWVMMRENEYILDVIRRHQIKPQNIAQNQVLPNLGRSLNERTNG
ncbi:MAG: ankyrin repeat domain-containing protein [Alphaproteobacteria bacterium]|nr:ankyrin repeat domain-containing protein [Alphaproteobacteria bacterium]